MGCRFDDGAGGDNEVQRTMLELINQLDGFDPRGNIKVRRSEFCRRSVNCISIMSVFLFLPLALFVEGLLQQDVT
jgi:hypothetical protein